MKTAAELDREIAEFLAAQITIDMPFPEISRRLSYLMIRIGELRTVRPRPIQKLYGLRGPTPEQLAAYKEETKIWNRAYRRAQKAYKEGVAISNEKLRQEPARVTAAWTPR
jgi:hypothetical protein